MIYGYARVSTAAQDLDAQRGQLTAAGCGRIFHDKLSGLNADRPQLRKMLATVEAGDTVIIPAIDRLSRDVADLLTIARDLQAAGVGLRSLAEPIIDTRGELSEIVLAVLGLAAKLHHGRIRTSTAIGRAAAKARGVKFGAKPKLTPHQQREAIQRREAGTESVRAIAASYNVSHSTISRLR